MDKRRVVEEIRKIYHLVRETPTPVEKAWCETEGPLDTDGLPKVISLKIKFHDRVVSESVETTDTPRADFETAWLRLNPEWCSLDKHDVFKRFKNTSKAGEYIIPSVELGWRLWQEASKHGASA